MQRVLAASALVALLFGCAAKFGPGEHGWAKWDICGFEGGVTTRLVVMGTNSWALGCAEAVEVVDHGGEELRVRVLRDPDS